MTSGGSRPRAGRKSGTERAKFSPTALPSEGYAKRPPAFPLPRLNLGSTAATKRFRDREMAIWREIWKTPQAEAWAREPYRWSTVAEFCRIKTSVEAEAGSNAALVSRLREYRNEIGLSPDGLKMNGWAIAVDQVAEQAAKKTTTPPKKKAAPTRRLRSVGGAAKT